jgi:hypothetical protein
VLGLLEGMRCSNSGQEQMRKRLHAYPLDFDQSVRSNWSWQNSFIG